MVAFDLLYLNGYDLRRLRLFERKALLKKIIAETDIQFSDSFDVDGREIYEHACKTGLEGVVSKVRDTLRFGPRQRLGEGDVPASRDAADRRLCA
jgi:bifunctional non-homologous end joining protein LigD